MFLPNQIDSFINQMPDFHLMSLKYHPQYINFVSITILFGYIHGKMYIYLYIVFKYLLFMYDTFKYLLFIYIYM